MSLCVCLRVFASASAALVSWPMNLRQSLRAEQLNAFYFWTYYGVRDGRFPGTQTYALFCILRVCVQELVSPQKTVPYENHLSTAVRPHNHDHTCYVVFEAIQFRATSVFHV